LAFWTEEDKAERAERGRELQDVVIVGGGIVGSALACNLKSNPVFHGKKVTVIEPSPPKQLEDANASLGLPDARVYTITPASKKLFEAIGVWDKIKPEHIAPFGHMQVWDAMGDGFIRFDAAKAQVKSGSDLGYVLEHGVLQRALALRMQELAGQDDPNPLRILSPAEVHAPSSSTSSSPYLTMFHHQVRNFEGPGEVHRAGTITLEDGTEIRSRLVVAADGGKSMIRKLSALGTWGWTYDQQAVVATVKTDQINTTAFQRFLPSGPIALLPLRDGYSSVVWSTTENHAIELKSISPQEFVVALNEALHKPSVTPSPPQVPLLGNLIQGIHLAAQTVLAAGALADPFQAPPKATEAVGRRIAFPLKLQHATRYSSYMFYDDADMDMGLNLGLADVTSLGNVLSQGVQAGVHLGDELFLKHYDNDRKKANISMALAMDGFKNLFGPAPDAVQVARNVGMSTLNAVEPIKVYMMILGVSGYCCQFWRKLCMMRGVARWLRTSGDDDEEDDDEEAYVEDIDSEEDDGEFIDGVKQRKDKSTKGLAAAAVGKKARKKKGQDDKGQLRMSFFVQRDSPIQTTSSKGGGDVLNARIAGLNDASHPTVEDTMEEATNPTDADPSIISIEDDSFVHEANAVVASEDTIEPQPNTAMPDERGDDEDGSNIDVKAAASPASSHEDPSMSNHDRPVDDTVTGRQTASKRKQSAVHPSSCTTNNSNMHLAPPATVPSPLKRRRVKANAGPTTMDETQAKLRQRGGAPSASTLLAPQRRNNPVRDAQLAKDDVLDDMELVEPTRRTTSRLRTLRSNDMCRMLVVADPPPVAPARRAVHAKKPATPSMFLTTEQRDAAKRQDVALLDEQRQVQAMLKFQQDLERRKALDVAFFAGREGVNPFFQPPQPLSSSSVVTIDDDDKPGDVVLLSGVVVWKKEPAPTFPAPSHVNAMPPVAWTVSTDDDAWVPPRRGGAAAPLVLSIDDDDDEVATIPRARMWTALRHDQDVYLQLQTTLDDVFWCCRGGSSSSTAAPRTCLDIDTSSNHAIQLQQQPSPPPPRGGLRLLVDQYAPQTSHDVVGNRHSVKWLCEWLRAWKSFRDGKSLRRVCEQYHDLFAAKNGADNHTYVSDDDDDDDGNEDLLHRVFVLQGESGTGKTCSVYACARELGYQVLEMNAGQPRSGKHLLELAGEATQSNRVVQTPVHLDTKPPSKKKQKKKATKNSPPPTTTSLTLVLLEDVDHLFESDKGFMAALHQIAKNARCPIVLTCTGG
ncbi:hypothetical protein DYB26_002522, partial [Aphanomyces astaci]